jgi:hypothetical protein
MANVKKITKRETLTNLIARYPNDSELVAYCEHEIELLDNKKASGSKKVNETALVHETLVYNALASMGKPVTPTDLIVNTDLSALKNDKGVVTTQRVSACLTKLVASGKAIRTVDKKSALYSIATE